MENKATAWALGGGREGREERGAPVLALPRQAGLEGAEVGSDAALLRLPVGAEGGGLTDGGLPRALLFPPLSPPRLLGLRRRPRRGFLEELRPLRRLQLRDCRSLAGAPAIETGGSAEVRRFDPGRH